MNKFNIYDNLEFGEDKVKITPMFNSDTSKEIRIAFKKDQIMKDHKTSFSISVQICEGEIEFGVGEMIYTLVKGDVVSLEANVVHNLKANAESVVRLTLSKADTIARVQGVLKL